MITRNLSIFTAALFSLGVQGTANAQFPNYYECSGRNVQLTLTVGSGAEIGIVATETNMNLQIGKNNFVFRGEEVNTEETLIGDLWEVVLKAVPDQSTLYATLVTPEINLGDSPVQFATKLILTKAYTSITGEPPEGVVNPSKYKNLFCTASLLFF